MSVTSRPVRVTPLGMLLGRASRLVDRYDSANEADRKALVARLCEAVAAYLEDGDAP